jgi:fatty-acyl-CoA synthase
MPKLSYVCGTSDRPLLYKTVGNVLSEAAGRWPDNEAIVVCHENVRLTYRELDNEVDEVARGLLAAGLKSGDRVGIWSPNNLAWVLMQFATARAGLILVCINPAYRTDDLKYALRSVGCAALVFAPSFKKENYGDIINALIPWEAIGENGKVSCADFPDLRLLVQLGANGGNKFLSFADMCRSGESGKDFVFDDPAIQFDAEQAINIQFTSGTTGRPKGATLTHINIVNNGFFVGEAMRLGSADRLCIPVPLYHCFGMVLGVLAAVTHGTTMVFPSEAFDAEAVLSSVAAERCTALHGVPTMFIAELEHPRFSEFDLSSLRTGIMAGAPCPVAIMRRVVDEMHMEEITICYGMTETSPVSFQSSIGDPIEKRVSTVGRVHPHVQVKLVNESGEVVPIGESGEILTRGYSVMKGYWGDAEHTSLAIDENGWMHTGDLGILDADGYCNVVGRLKDTIIRGGENIYPREIEEFLFLHPKILDVAVVGVADPKYGEAVCATIRLRDDAIVEEEEIVDFCRGRIADYKIPRYIRFVDSFPMTVSGKAQKYVIRRQAELELGVRNEQTA